MVITLAVTIVPGRDGHRLTVRARAGHDGRRRGQGGGPPRWPSRCWCSWCAGARSVEAGEGLADAEDELAVDELLLAAGCVAESGAGQAIDLAQGALGQLMERGEGVVGEEVVFASCMAEAEADVLGGVGDRRGREQEAVMDAREQRAVCPTREVLLQLGETDEDERQESLGVPLVIEQDVEEIGRA